MSKVKPQKKGAHEGCRIFGYRKFANGAPDQKPLSVIPEQMVVSGNVLFDGSSFEVKPGKDGYFEFTVPPGKYRFNVAEGKFLQVHVPDQGECSLQDLVTPPGQQQPPDNKPKPGKPK